MLVNSTFEGPRGLPSPKSGRDRRPSTRWTRWGSWICTVVFVPLAITTALVGFTRERLLDADAFASMTGQAIEDPAINDLLATAVTDNVLGQGPGYLQVLEPAVHGRVRDEGATPDRPRRDLHKKAALLLGSDGAIATLCWRCLADRSESTRTGFEESSVLVRQSSPSERSSLQPSR